MSFALPTISTNWHEPVNPFGIEVFDVERAALGCPLLNPAAMHDLVDVLGDDPGVFRDQYAQRVYAELLEACRAERAIDLVTICERLRRKHDDEPAEGWNFYVGNLSASVPTSTHARDYARMVREQFETDEVVRGCEIVSTAKDPYEHLPQMMAKLSAFTNRTEQSSVARASHGLDDVLADLDARAHGNFTAAIPTGYATMDRTLRGGLHPGEVTVAAARPSGGKTAFMINVAVNAARMGTPVFIASAEMPRAALQQRMISLCGGCNVNRIQSGWQYETDLARARQGAAEVKHLPVYIEDTPAITITKLAAKAAIFVRKHSKALIVIDYLQLLQSGQKFSTREAEVAFISREVKRIARVTNCPVLLACQLNRESEKETDHFRKLACMRESGAVEQDADVVIIVSPMTEAEVAVYAKALNGQSARLRESSILTIAKHRNGATGKVLLHFDKPTQRFSDFDLRGDMNFDGDQF